MQCNSHFWGDSQRVASVIKAASTNGIHTALLRQEIFRSSWHDLGVVRHILSGFPYVGIIPVNPSARPSIVREATLSIQELREKGPFIRETVISRMTRHNIKKSAEEDPERSADRLTIWKQTMDEANIGRMEDPRPLIPDQTPSRPVTKRFGVRQMTSKGKEKVRCIDDLLESFRN